MKLFIRKQGRGIKFVTDFKGRCLNTFSGILKGKISIKKKGIEFLLKERLTEENSNDVIICLVPSELNYTLKFIPGSLALKVWVPIKQTDKI